MSDYSERAYIDYDAILESFSEGRCEGPNDAKAIAAKILELLAENERLRSWHGQSVESHALTTAELGEAQSENARLLAENEALREKLHWSEHWCDAHKTKAERLERELRALTEKQDG